MAWFVAVAAATMALLSIKQYTLRTERQRMNVLDEFPIFSSVRRITSQGEEAKRLRLNDIQRMKETRTHTTHTRILIHMNIRTHNTQHITRAIEPKKIS